MTDTTDKKKLLESFAPEWNPLVRLGQELGPEAVDRFLAEFGGTKPHHPSAQNFWGLLERAARDEEIRSRFNPVTCGYEQLALETGLDARQIRRIVHKEPRRRDSAREPERNVKMYNEPHEALSEIAKRYCLSVRCVLDILARRALADDELMAAVKREAGERSGVSVDDMFGTNRTNNVRESESIC